MEVGREGVSEYLEEEVERKIREESIMLNECNCFHVCVCMGVFVLGRMCVFIFLLICIHTYTHMHSHSYSNTWTE